MINKYYLIKIYKYLLYKKKNYINVKIVLIKNIYMNQVLKNINKKNNVI